jgi:hypothetical protein
MSGDEDSANQNKPIGRAAAPTIMGGRRSSGISVLPLLAFRLNVVSVYHDVYTPPPTTPTQMDSSGNVPPIGLYPRCCTKLMGYALSR